MLSNLQVAMKVPPDEMIFAVELLKRGGYLLRVYTEGGEASEYAPQLIDLASGGSILGYMVEKFEQPKSGISKEEIDAGEKKLKELEDKDETKETN